MPTKTKDKWVRYSYTSDSTQPPKFKQVNAQTRKLTRSVTGGLNPKWKNAIAHHQNATTALSGTWQVVESVPVYSATQWETTVGQAGHPMVVTDRTYGHFTLYGRTFASGSFGSLAGAQNLARVRFNKRLQAQQRSIEGGVLLGELRETIHMLRRPAQALLGKLDKYLFHVSKRNRGNRNRKKAKDVIAETWLEHAFGWAPLFNDISDAYELYKRLGNKETYTKVSAGGTSRKEVNLAAPTYETDGYLGNTFLYTERLYEETHVRIKGEIRVRAVTNTQTFLEQAGLTFDQFVPTLWELLPWSFLVDYFTNIGDILGYSNRIMQDLTWYYEGYRTDLVKECAHTFDFTKTKARYGSRWRSSEGTPGLAKLITRTVSRSVPSGIVSWTPTLEVSMDLSVKQWCNVTALLVSANRTSPQRFSQRR